MPDRFLVTGANGCIGAWTVAQLIARGVRRSSRSTRPTTTTGCGWCSIEDELGAVTRVRGDITDLDALERTLDEHAITHVIHLAALQVPFCRADPPLGARVNVVGTVNVFEAVARRADRMGPVVYASSVAAYDALDEATTGAAMQGVPSTLYGVYKRANEGTATVYAAERGVASVGLRPHTVYGPGRDQGLTSAPTSAMLAAAAGRPYKLPFGGAYQLQYAPGRRRGVRRGGARRRDGAELRDVGGPTVHTDELIAGDRRGRARRRDHLRTRRAPVPGGHRRRGRAGHAARGRASPTPSRASATSSRAGSSRPP